MHYSQVYVSRVAHVCRLGAAIREYSDYLAMLVLGWWVEVYWSYNNQYVGYMSESHEDACISLNMDQVVDSSDNGLSAA